MIKSIYLENWKTHLDTKLSFQKGTNILLGVIGSGKSSVVDGICYALYGTFPTLSNRKVTLDETIMFKPSKKDYFKVILELEQDEKTYLIEREFFSGNKANSAKIYLEGKLLAGPKKSDVDDFVSKLLGIDYNLFIKVVYSQQNEIDYFLKIAPSKRKEQFDDLFGISHFENIKISTREIDRLLLHEQDKNELLLKQISSQISSYNLSSLREEETKLKEKINLLEKELLENENKKRSLETSLKEKKEIKEKHDSLSSQYTLYLSRLEDTLKEIETLSTKIDPDTTLSFLEDEKKILSSLEKDFLEKQNKNKETEILKKSLENKYAFYRNNLLEIEGKITQIKSSLTEVDFTSHVLSSLKKEVLEEINSLNISKLSLLSKQKDLEKSSQELSKGFSNCPVCQTPFTKEHLEETINHVRTEKENISKEITILLDKLSLKEKSLEDINKKEKIIEKNNLLESQLQEIEKQLIENKSLQESVLEETKALPSLEDLSSLEKEILLKKDDLKTKEEYLKLISKKKEFEEKVSSLKTSLSNISYKEEDYLNLLAENKNIEVNFISLKDSLNTSLKSLDSLNKQISSLESLDKQKEEVSSSLKNISTKKQDLSYFLKAIDNSQLQLRKVLIDNINQALTIIWPKVYPYKDYLSARLNADNDYILEVLTLKNDWIRVEGLLSGGERACASLSIRMAISLILTKKLGLLILDEPTHNLDEKSVEALSNILEEELPDLVDQIFIVTHDNKLLETINATKFIIERDKENDSASKILF